MGRYNKEVASKVSPQVLTKKKTNSILQAVYPFIQIGRRSTKWPL